MQIEVDPTATMPDPVTPPVQADVLISNSGQADGQLGGSIFDHAQAFTTGSNENGYILSSVDIKFASFTASQAAILSDLTVELWSSKTATITGGVEPDSRVATLRDPISLTQNALNTFTAPSDTLLTKGTTYFVVMDGSRNLNWNLRNTASDAEDSGGATGWSIANNSLYRASSIQDWTDSFSETKIIRINGNVHVPGNNSATGAPTISGTPEVGEILSVSTANITDADGKTKAEAGDTGYAYTYQWIRGNHDIPGATASTYTLTDDDDDQMIQVQVTFTDDSDNLEVLLSDPLAIGDAYIVDYCNL